MHNAATLSQKKCRSFEEEVKVRLVVEGATSSFVDYYSCVKHHQTVIQGKKNKTTHAHSQTHTDKRTHTDKNTHTHKNTGKKHIKLVPQQPLSSI
jgi:hypothetical protein